jgi:lactoylglutathione lyase
MKMVHVTIRTKAFEAEIDFYKTYAGLSIVEDMRKMGQNIVFLADKEGDTCIEVIENPKAENSGSEHFSIGFSVEDVDAKRKELEEAGFSVSPVAEPVPHVRFFFVTDPAGVSVQFI